MSSVRPVRLWELLALAVTVFLGACADATPDDSAEEASAASSTPPAAGQFNDADVVFLEGMVPHHAQAVEMAEMVDGRMAHPDELGELAQEIIATQQEEIDTMNGLLEQAGEDPVDADSDMGGMDHGDMAEGDMAEGDMDMSGMMSSDDMTALMDAEGEAFDQMFLAMMIEHHRGAIEAAERVLADGENAEVATLAEDVIEAQQAEISRMEGWQEDWTA